MHALGPWPQVAGLGITMSNAATEDATIALGLSKHYSGAAKDDLEAKGLGLPF